MESQQDDAPIDWPPFPSVSPRVATPPPVRYAGLLVRLVAFSIDGVVLALFTFPLAFAGLTGIKAGVLVIGIRAVPLDADAVFASLVAGGWTAMAIVYFTALHRDAGQTIGKALVGIRVRSLDLGSIGAVRSLVRTLGYALSSSFFGFGFLLIALTPRRRGWHDLLAGTCVVHFAPGET